MDLTPFFSIVIATRARPRQLRDCLTALDLLDYPRDRFEALVVDDGGPLPLDEIVAPFRDRFDLTLLTQAHAGPAAARNAGVARAKGAVLVFTDDDCAPAPGWLRGFASQLERSPGSMVGGRTLNALPDNVFSTASQLLVDYLYGYFRAGSSRFFTTNNLAAPAERFRALGGFDSRFTRAAAEDREFCDRWLRSGARLSDAPDAIVHHRHHLGPRTFWRQHYNYGRGALQFHRSRAALGGRRVRIEPPDFYLGLVSCPMSGDRKPRASLLVSLLIVSQVANAAGFLAAWVGRDGRRGADQVQAGRAEGAL